MKTLFQFINRAFDVILSPFRALDPLFGLTIVSLTTGLLLILVFRYASNQKAIRRIKNHIQAHFLELRLFPDQLGVVCSAYGKIVLGTFAYLGYVLQPLAVIFIPMTISLVQFDLRYGYRPFVPKESFLVAARLEPSIELRSVSLHVPLGLALTAPALHIPLRHEVDWRLAVKQYGDWFPTVFVNGRPYAKEVIVSKSIMRISSKRVQGRFWNEFLHPGEPPLPANGPLRSIEVSYPARSINLGAIHMDWIWFFLLASICSGLIIKMVLGVQL